MLHPITLLPPFRRIRVLTVGLAATIGLYLLTVFVAEPTRSLASNTETVGVQVTVAAVTGFACDGNSDGLVGSGETLSLGTLTYTGDTGAYSNARAVKCFVRTNNTAGYDISWQVTTGSGATGAHASTGHLVSFYDKTVIIQAFGTGSNYTKTWGLGPNADNASTNDSRWGGRVSSTSSGSDVVPMLFGTDTSSEKWARVATGATQLIRRTSAQSQGGSGDLIRIGFRAEVGATKIQPTSTYKAIVTFTAAPR